MTQPGGAVNRSIQNPIRNVPFGARDPVLPAFSGHRTPRFSSESPGWPPIAKRSACAIRADMRIRPASTGRLSCGNKSIARRSIQQMCFTSAHRISGSQWLFWLVSRLSRQGSDEVHPSPRLYSPKIPSRGPPYLTRPQRFVGEANNVPNPPDRASERS